VVDVGDDAEISYVRYVHLSCVPGRESAVQGRLPCPVYSLLQLARPLLIPREDTGKRCEEKRILRSEPAFEGLSHARRSASPQAMAAKDPPLRQKAGQEL
jgi:hypothetical protein